MVSKFFSQKELYLSDIHRSMRWIDSKHYKNYLYYIYYINNDYINIILYLLIIYIINFIH